MEKYSKEHSKGRAGLPQEVKFSDYPKVPHQSGDLDDTIKGIDEVNTRGVGKAKKHMSHQK
jgi:hypothetical protein